jgi:pSer/pThr/pTyr-binding forkhead associated (FHA) protein
MADGEVFLLADGIEVVVGRSRSCPISLRRTANYLRASPAARDNDHDFNTVSRRHVRILVTGTKVDLEDLSSNGTFVANEVLSGRMTIDLAEGPCSIRLGTRERFDLQLVAKDDPRLVGKEPVVAAPAGSGD